MGGGSIQFEQCLYILEVEAAAVAAAGSGKSCCNLSDVGQIPFVGSNQKLRGGWGSSETPSQIGYPRLFRSYA